MIFNVNMVDMTSRKNSYMRMMKCPNENLCDNKTYTENDDLIKIQKYFQKWHVTLNP